MADVWRKCITPVLMPRNAHDAWHASKLSPCFAAALPQPQGTLLPGPLQKEAAVRLAASCSTLLGGAAQTPPADFASLADASEALPQVAGQVCRQAAEAYASAMRLQVRGRCASFIEAILRSSNAVVACDSPSARVPPATVRQLSCAELLPLSLPVCTAAVHDGRGCASVD